MPSEEDDKIKTGKVEIKKEGLKLENIWKIYNDGALISDGSGTGLILISPKGEEYIYALRFEFEITNNEAEYEALLAGLRIIDEMEIKILAIFVDSQLIVNQVKGLFEAMQPAKKQYLERLNKSLKNFDTYSMEHIRRNQNKKADTLGKLASMNFEHLTKEVLVEVLANKSINDKKVSTIAVEKGEYWMIPFYDIWEALGENTRDLDSIWEETRKIATLHEVVSRKRIWCLETALQFLATPSELTSDGVKIYVTASKRNHLKETLRRLGKAMTPSYEGYRNTIELPDGNNVVPLQSDTIRLVQNGCSFHGLWSENPNQHLKDFLKLVDSVDLDVTNRERTRLLLFQFFLRDQAINWLERLPAGSISTWEDLTTRFLAQFFPPGRIAKLQNDILMFQQLQGESLSEAWTRFKDLLQKSTDGKLCDAKESWELLEDLALYDNESWNDLRDFTKSVKAISLPQDVPSTSGHRLIKFENQVQRLMEAHLALNPPDQVNKIASSLNFTIGDDEIAYKMPHKIEQYNSLSDLEKEHTKAVYFRNEEDKRRATCLHRCGGGFLILYQAYDNLYATIGRKAHLLEDKQIPSVGVFDKVIWEALGENTRDLDSIWKEMGQDCDFTRVVSRMHVQCLETASQFLATPSELTSDDVKIYVTVLERNCLKETIRRFGEATALKASSKKYTKVPADLTWIPALWFGVPEIITSKADKQFREGIFVDFCKGLKITQSFSPITEHVEIMNHIKKQLVQSQQIWVDDLA
ncbi:MAK10-like protein [Tanacetum coccineum]